MPDNGLRRKFDRIPTMTENSANSEERMKDADRERIGFLKHISVVSLAALAFIGGVGTVGNGLSGLLKAAGVFFLLAEILSLVVLVLNVANIQYPRGSPYRFSGGELLINRGALACAIFLVLAGCVLLALEYLLS